jgi:hypothetical protein
MKKVFASLLPLAALLIIFCEKQVDIEAEKADVQTTINQFYQILETEDIQLLSQLVTHDEDAVSFGTDAAERWVGWESFKEAIQQQFDAFDSTKLNVRDQVVKVSKSGTVAWYSEIVDFQIFSQGEQINVDGLRATGVLEKRDGRWIVVQVHNSIPVSGQAVEY